MDDAMQFLLVGLVGGYLAGGLTVLAVWHVIERWRKETPDGP